MSRLMRSAIFRGKGRIDMIERPVPTLGPRDVLVQVGACALCGSDKRLFERGATVTPGHEIAGRVVSVGSEVDGLDSGEPSLGAAVVIYIPLYCGRCPACLRGQTNCCADLRKLIGWQLDGGFQQYLAVPVRNVLPVPEGIELSKAVLALDTVGTAAHGLRSSLRFLGGPPQQMAVIGCGPLGIGAAVVGEALGATNVTVDDIQLQRVRAAVELGFRRTDADAGRVPLVVEASGSSEGRDRAMTLVEPGGVVLLLGEGEQPWVVPATPAWRRLEAAYLRSFYFPLSEVADNWSLLRRCENRLATLVDDVRSLSELSAVFEDFVSGRTVKPMVIVT